MAGVQMESGKVAGNDVSEIIPSHLVLLVGYERQHQRDVFKPDEDVKNSPEDWAELITDQADRLTRIDGEPTRSYKKRLIKIGALVFAALEADERKSQLEKVGQ